MGAKRAQRLTVPADQELGEIPLDLATDEARELHAQPLEQRMRIGPFDIDLFKHREAHAVIDKATAFNGVGVAGLLIAELVAGKARHHETLIGVLAI